MIRKALIVDDDPSMCELIARALQRLDFQTVVATSGTEALNTFDADDTSVIITDLNMPGLGGIDLCRGVLARQPGIPVIVITAFGSMDTAIEALQAGAYDFVTKPIDLDLLGLSAQRAVESFELRREVKRLRRGERLRLKLGDMIGDSAPMRELYRLLESVCDSDASLLVTGETGTGKELIARAAHDGSHRSEKPFVAVNCAAMPATLLESEFFGHIKGAFTDARSNHPGIFEQADGGTVFLDEIGDLPMELQPKLLRAIQERTVRPLGATRETSFDARIIAATHMDLDRAVKEGQFREDLLYRIRVIELNAPPLRERGNDILALAQSFLSRFSEKADKAVAGVSPEAARRLLDYAWPGNVRELENCMERAVALASHDHILIEDLPERIQRQKARRSNPSSPAPKGFAPLHEVEKRYILEVLDAYEGNKRQAAIALGLDRKTLWRKLKAYGMK